MAKRYHIEKLNTMLQHLAGILHVSILILDENGNTLSKIADTKDYCSALRIIDGVQSKCNHCDKQIVERCRQSKRLESHICHAGLCDLAMPITQNECIVAYVVLGRIRTAQSPKTPCYAGFRQHIDELYDAVPYFTEEVLEHLCHLLPQIVLDCTITIEYENFTDDIAPYIREHLRETLSVPALCQRYHLSKNTIYRFFKDEYNCSIGEFIARERLKVAKELLSTTELTVSDVAESVGINNYTYFCRWFKQQSGSTPTTYRHSNRKTDESI